MLFLNLKTINLLYLTRHGTSKQTALYFTTYLVFWLVFLDAIIIVKQMETPKKVFLNWMHCTTFLNLCTQKRANDA